MWNSKKFFDENESRLGPEREAIEAEPEKLNLYRGLSAMAEELHALHDQLKRVEVTLTKIESKVRALEIK